MLNRRSIIISIVLIVGFFYSSKGQTNKWLREDSTLKFEFPDMRIGVAEKEEGPTEPPCFISQKALWPQVMLEVETLVL